MRRRSSNSLRRCGAPHGLFRADCVADSIRLDYGPEMTSQDFVPIGDLGAVCKKPSAIGPQSCNSHHWQSPGKQATAGVPALFRADSLSARFADEIQCLGELFRLAGLRKAPGDRFARPGAHRSAQIRVAQRF